MNLPDVVAILASFVFTGIYAGAETGSYMINRIRLRRRVRHRRHSARVLSWVLRDPHIFVFTVLFGQNIAVYILTTTVTGLYIGNGIDAHGGGRLFGILPWNAEMAATLTLMFPLFLFAEVGPKNLFRKRADSLMYRFAGLLRISVLCFYPFTFLLKRLFRLLTRHINEEVERELHRLSPDGLKEYFSASEKEGVISSYQSQMMDSVTSMHSVPVRSLMTPLKNIPQLPAAATVADFRRLGAASALLMDKHAVTGLVSMFAIVNRKLDDSQPLKPYAEDVLRIEESRNLRSAFYRLRRNPHHSAVVVDSRKHPAGFVRLEDIARHIAGK
jgi:CBS domain containing-hemolysin-like protein